MKHKSAAEFKPIKTEKRPDLPPIEETFENAKQAFINTLEVSITLAKRVDNLLNIRDYVTKYWKDTTFLDGMLPDDRMKYLKKMQNISINAYEDLYNHSKEFELDEFLNDEMKDYYEDITPKIEDIKTEEELCEAGLIFLTVKPFGEKMTSLHHTMLDEKMQREYTEKE